MSRASIAVLLFLAAPASAGVLASEVEAELRVGLTKSGYDKLAAKAEAAVESRTDSYFDYYDGREFRLKRLLPPFKVRVKQKSGKTGFKTQVSRVNQRETVERNGLRATASVAESWKGTYPAASAAQLAAALDAFFQELSGSAPVRALANAAGAFLASDAILAFVPAQPGAELLPAARNTKLRRTLRLTLPSGPLVADLGMTQALDERGAQVLLCELEAESKSADPKSQALELLDALQGLGLTAQDVETSPTPNAYLFTESRLAQGAANSH